MSSRTVATVLATVALLIAIAATVMTYNLMKRELVCTYRTYINASCTAGICTFNIPAEPGKWYKIIDAECHGNGMLSIFFTTGHGVYAKIEGNGIAVVLGPNETTSLPVKDSATYSIYVMTNVTLGRVVGKLVIVEVS